MTRVRDVTAGARRALITGITGQDGSYLAELLLDKGYEVHGLVRRASSPTDGRIAHLRDRLHLHAGDLLDQGSLVRAVEASRPHEVYHLAAQSYVGRSWSEPVYTADVTGLGAVRLLEAVRMAAPSARVYQASTSELYGAAGAGRVGPEGPFRPRSPYGVAKLLAHHAAINHRESFGMFVCAGILFNHESPRRGDEFVTAKVARAAAGAARGARAPLRLGNLAARRDWGWAPEYVEAMWRMLQVDTPMDLVVGTGVAHSVQDLVEVAYATVGLDWRDHVETDASLLRPADVDHLCADPTGAEAAIGWRAQVGFEELVERLVRAELAKLPPA
jgi:GDPmannose 4,6-dehydratase